MKKARWLALLLGLMLLAGALAPAAPEDANKVLAQEQLKLVRQILADLDREYKDGILSVNDPKINLWERRQVEAVRASGAPKAEIVAAFEAYAKRMKSMEDVAKKRYEQDMVPRVAVFEARYDALEAEMWLNQEKAR